MKDINIVDNISNKEFSEMLDSVGWKKYREEQIDLALKNTMYMAKVEVNGVLAGIGRVVGDGSIVCLLTDIIVKPEYQHQGIGTLIVKDLKKKIEENVKIGDKMMIELTPTKGNEAFYQNVGFQYNPEKITGMYLWIIK